MAISIDEAIALLARTLRRVPPLSPDSDQRARQNSRGCDLSVAGVFEEWWQGETARLHPKPASGEMDYAPFLDGAWELARRGIIRPGVAFPAFRRIVGHDYTEADGFSLTMMGREWVARFDQEEPFSLDPGRFSKLVQTYADRFGPAFIQRATEAAGCYRTLNYFAACTMSGAACETMLLALAIAKTGDEEKTTKIYLGRDGRRDLINLITTDMKTPMKRGIETATSILSYWRDSAAHGLATEISEFEAHDALSRLLRFAQFVDKNWDHLIA